MNRGSWFSSDFSFKLKLFAKIIFISLLLSSLTDYYTHSLTKLTVIMISLCCKFHGFNMRVKSAYNTQYIYMNL